MDIPIDTISLELYDVVLMIMGAMLFLACLVIFVIQSMQAKVSRSLLAFFALSIIMVGFPAITKIQVGEQFMLEKRLRNTAESIAEGNTQPKTIQAFRQTLAKLEKSGNAIEDPGLLTGIARAQYELGEIDQAKAYTRQALQLNNNYLPALELQEITRLHDRKTDALAASLERAASPDASAADSAAVRETIGTINETALKLSNPELLERAAAFEIETGNREEAMILLKRSRTLEEIRR